MSENLARDAPDEHTVRVRLALSLLQRTPSELTCELAVMALRGATVDQLHEYQRASGPSAGAA